ncbi:MAG: polyprenyl diphosphate synthase [Deinococcota bacterium]
MSRLSRLSHALHLWHRISQPLYWFYERRLFAEVVHAGKMPNHVGLILDGNRRFARSLGLHTSRGHDLGAEKVHEVLTWCRELAIQHVTLWVFSTDNQNRDQAEVEHILNLLASEAVEQTEQGDLHKYQVKTTIIGDLAGMPEHVVKALRKLEQVTANYNKMFLNIAVGYGGREEITHAVRSWLRTKLEQGETLEQVIGDLASEVIESHLYTAGFPDPDFVIRTSGELRMSGFLLWQTAYSEFYFCDVFWPSFRKLDFLRAIRSFQARQRRFGR